MEASVTKRIAKNFSWLFFGNGLNGLMVLFMTVYVARVLGAASYGLYQFAQAFLIYLVLLVDHGLSILGVKEIACDKTRASQTALNIFVVRFLVACSLYFLAAGFLIVLPVNQQVRLLFFATFFFVFYRALSSEWVFQGLETMEYIPIFKIITTILTFGLTLWIIKGPQDIVKFPLIQAVVGVSLAVIFLMVIFRWILPARAKMLTPQKWGSIFWRALPLGVSVLLVQIYSNMDTIMLGFMDRQEVVGYYNVAYKVFYVCLGIFVVWLQTALPVMSRRMATDLASARVFIIKYARLTALAFIPMMLFVFLLAPVIIELVFGQEYLRAIPALRILILQLLSVTIGTTFSLLILIPAGRYKDYLISVGVGASVNIVLNFLLIPRFSMLGAATATIVAEISSMLTAVYFARRVLGLELVRQYILPGTLAVLALLGYGLVFMLDLPVALVWRQVAGGITYLLIYSAMVFAIERRFIFGFVREIYSR